VTITVPAQYVPLLQEMSAATGISYDVLAAQANDESGFQADVTSSAGAEGWLQFLPSTYNSVASQAGVQPGTEDNPSDEAKAYDVYMKQLLAQFGGNVQDALAAYNAGPDDIAAGMSYANSILSAAGVSGNVTAGPAQGTGTTATASLDSFSITNPATWIPAILSGLGIETDIEDLAERGALIVFGAILIIVGVIRLTGSEDKAKTVVQNAGPAAGDAAPAAEDAAVAA
jgi:Transglycosylase SLT domain